MVDGPVDKPDTDNEHDSNRKRRGFAQETLLELIVSENGSVVLQDMSGEEDPLVTIQFSDKVKTILGNDVQMIGHHMVHAAIQAVMHRQISQWHAHVYDEEPEHYS